MKVNLKGFRRPALQVPDLEAAGRRSLRQLGHHTRPIDSGIWILLGPFFSTTTPAAK